MLGSPCRSVRRWAERAGRSTGLTWWSQAGRLKSDALAGVQRTKCFIEHQPGLEVKDSFQTGLALNEPTGLDLEPLDNREHQESWGRSRAGGYQCPKCVYVHLGINDHVRAYLQSLPEHCRGSKSP